MKLLIHVFGNKCIYKVGLSSQHITTYRYKDTIATLTRLVFVYFKYVNIYLWSG